MNEEKYLIIEELIEEPLIVDNTDIIGREAGIREHEVTYGALIRNDMYD